MSLFNEQELREAAQAMTSASGPTGGYLMPQADQMRREAQSSQMQSEARSTGLDHLVQKSANDGIMVAFLLDGSTANHLLTLARGCGVPDDCLLSADDMHITLAYLGQLPAFPALDVDGIAAVLQDFARGWSEISGSLNGVGRFVDGAECDVLYINFDAPDLPKFRAALLYALLGNGIDPVLTHGFTPHATLAYIDKSTPTPTLPLLPFDVTFDTLTLVYGDDRLSIPMGAPEGVRMDMDAMKSKKPGKAQTISTSPEPDLNISATQSAADTSTEVMPDPGEAATMSADLNFAYPDESKLPMPDAAHVVLAAAALGRNPPHGQRAKIPTGKLGEVKARIRARAHALSLGSAELAKVNAYLSGHMPSDIGGKDVDTWTHTFARVLALTNDELKAALAAQGAINRSAMLGRKSAGADLPTTVEGWAMLFSDPDDLDLQGTYFDDMTRTLMDYYPKAPLWMEHGKDAGYGADPIGYRTLATVYPIGIWMEHALHTDHPMYARTAQDAADGAFSYSSDSLAHYAQQGFNPSDGHLGEWPLAGCSLTRTPAEPGLGPVQAKSLELALKSATLQREAAVEAAGSEVLAMKGNAMTMPTNAEEVLDTDSDTTVPAETAATKAFETPVPDVATAPASDLEALAQMYGVEVTPDAVRSAMDTHIAHIKESGEVDPELTKAMGLGDDVPPTDVEEHLNNLYSAALTPGKDDTADTVPAPTMSYNYGALATRHLHSGSAAAKSKGPYMTGEFAQKGVNANFGAKVPGVMEVLYDMMRVKNGMPMKFGSKAMTSATGPTGGYILRQEIVPNVLDPLRANAVCFRLGATREDMQGLQVKMIPAMQSAPSGNWIGENVAVTATQPSYRMITMVPHGYQVTVPIPINVEANMTPEAESQIREQMVMTGQLALDLAALTGPGSADGSNSGAAPIGILNTPGVRQVKLATNGRQPNYEDVVNFNRLLDQKNVPLQGAKRGMTFHSDVEASFTGQTDSLGRPLLRDSWADSPMPRIINFPYLCENQIPTNLTVGSTATNSYMFFGDWRFMHIGLSDVVELRLDQTFMQNLQVGLLVYFYADIKIVYPDAFIAATGVQGINISGVTVTTNS